ncbi:MAG: TonB-dependent receptor [Bacteroidales bacterium]|nr:TonB-dependent receptor [Bacteroidales bacterium]
MKKILFIILALGLNFTFSQAQRPGVISGRVMDKSTQTPLPGATVSIEGTAIGTITDLAGKYRLMGVPVGNQIAVISFVGYDRYTQELFINSGDDIEVNADLIMTSSDLEEVVVTAQMVGQVAAINQQLNSDALVSVVSSDKMRELPDINAAEAIGRLPGVSINRSGGEAQTINIRGFGSSYTSVTLNGIKMAETGSGNRAVNLSNISPDLLSHIEVFKSPTADMDGDAVGGIVSLGLKTAPKKAIYEFSLGTGYSTLKKVPNYKGNLRLSRRFLDNKFGVIFNSSFDITDRSTQRISTSYDSFLQDSTNTPIGYIVEPTNDLGLADVENTISRLGLNIQTDYEYNNGKIVLQGMYNKKNSDTYRQAYDYNGTGSNTYTLALNESTVDIYQLMLSAEHNLPWLEMDGTISMNKTFNESPYSPSIKFTDPLAFDNSINDVSVLDKITDKFDYLSYDYADATMSRMDWDFDTTINKNLSAVVNFKTNFHINSKIAGFIKFGGKVQMDTRERIYHPYFSRYDYDREQLFVTSKWLELTGEDILIAPNKNILIGNFDVQDKHSPFWNGEYSVWPYFPSSILSYWYENMNENSRPVTDEMHHDYNVEESIYASYIMGKLNVGKWLSFVPGIRYEYSDNYYQGQWSSLAGGGSTVTGMVKDTSVTKQYGHFLPSAHLKITPVKWMDFRLSYAKTLKRPNYSEIVPSMYVDIGNGYLQDVGNGDLKEMIAQSYDASVSFYSGKFGLLSLGVFSKEFTDYITEIGYTIPASEAIEMGLPASPWEIRSIYVNLPNKGYVKGFEIDIQTNFKYLPKPLDGLILNFNVTRLWSLTHLEKWKKIEYYDPLKYKMVIDFDSSYFYLEEAQLSSQVDLVLNTTLGYEYKGFSFRVSGQYQGIDLAGSINTGQTELSQNYNDHWFRMDVAMAQKIGEHIKLRFNIANLTNTAEKSYIYKPEYWRAESRYGAVYQFGLEYKF